MSKNTKIVVGIMVGVLIVCCLVAGIAAVVLPRMVANVAESAVVEDPEQAAAVASSILDYELPSGFTEAGGMNILGVKTVFFGSQNDQAAIMMMQFPAEMAGNEAQMQQQMEDAFAQQQGSGDFNLNYISTETVTINDAPATLTMYEGTDESGNTVRQVIGFFETKDGNAGMLMLFGAASAWEEAGFERFLESMQ
jgi:hypothetical protein